jgi:hypothetical protein
MAPPSVVLCRFNMETLQYEAPSPGHWMAVAKAINLTQSQKDDVYKIYQYASRMQATAMKRQAGIVQELQAILGSTGPKPRSTSEAVATAISDNAAAGPAQLVSLATGGAVPTAPAVADCGRACPFEGSAAAAQAGVEEMASFGPGSLAAVATAWEAVSPLSQDGWAFLTDFCRDSISSGAGHNGTTNSSLHSSSSSSWLAPAGVLTLQDAEKVKVLLEELVRVDMSVKQHTQQITVTVSACCQLWCSGTRLLSFSLPHCCMTALVSLCTHGQLAVPACEICRSVSNLL